MEIARVGLDRALRRHIAVSALYSAVFVPILAGWFYWRGHVKAHLPAGRSLLVGAEVGAGVFAFMMLFGLVVTLRWADLTADGLRPRGIGAGKRIAWSQVVAVECDERTQGRRTTAFVKVRGADGRTLTLPSHGLRGADDPAFVARLETVRQWWETYRTLSAST